MQSGLCISLELMSNSVRIGSLDLLYYVLDSVYQSEVLCMLESTCFFLRGGNCLQNLYQRSTTTTGRSGSRELKEVNFTLLLMRSDAAFEVYSSSRSSRTTEAAVLAFTSVSSSCILSFSAE